VQINKMKVDLESNNGSEKQHKMSKTPEKKENTSVRFSSSRIRKYQLGI
jgi:hypothetical protein